MFSKAAKRTIKAVRLGYTVVDGKVISPYRVEPLKTRVNRRGYHSFTIDRSPTYVHQVVAYMKYGEATFAAGIEVRHLDGNQANNLHDNIAIGSHAENMNDIPKEVLYEKSTKAATKHRVFSDEEMEEIKNFHGGSYKETMEQFGISSKGTLHYILNAEYVTTKP